MSRLKTAFATLLVSGATMTVPSDSEAQHGRRRDRGRTAPLTCASIGTQPVFAPGGFRMYDRDGGTLCYDPYLQQQISINGASCLGTKGQILRNTRQGEECLTLQGLARRRFDRQERERRRSARQTGLPYYPANPPFVGPNDIVPVPRPGQSFRRQVLPPHNPGGFVPPRGGRQQQPQPGQQQRRRDGRRRLGPQR